jgi:hypothetical protein
MQPGKVTARQPFFTESGPRAVIENESVDAAPNAAKSMEECV